MTVLAIVAAAMTVLYAASALGRVVPVKRRHHNWKNLSGMAMSSVLVLALAGGAFTVTSKAKHQSPSFPADSAAASSGLPVGVFTPGEWDSWAPVQQFSGETGQQIHYVLDYMGQDQPFPGNLGKLAAEHRAEPVLQLEPTMSMRGIAAGHDDAYLSSLASQVSGYGHPVVLSFAPEANGNWYSYGWTRTSPADYQAAWKHVMAKFKGVHNVSWMDTLNIDYQGSGPLSDYYVPGVSLVGIDGYYGNVSGYTFSSVFGQTLHEVRQLTRTPVMISETSIPSGDQAAGIPDLIQGARDNHLTGLIWFNQDIGTGQDWVLTPSGAAALKSALRPASIPVLLYHGINGTDDPDSDNVTLAEFRQQMAYLHKEGYQTISPGQYQLWAEGKPVGLPAKPVLLTADCNQASLLKALPVLRQFHYRVVMYVVTGFADGGYNGPEGQPGHSYYLNWADLQALEADGYIYPQFHAGACGHGYTMASSPYGCGDGLTPTPGTIWGHRYYSAPMGQSQAAYHARVQRDIGQGMGEMESRLRMKPAELTETFAVPFSDYGQPSTTNQPWLGSYLASRYSVVFVQSVNSPKNGTTGTGNRAPRFEVDKPTTMRQFIAGVNSSQFTGVA
jgi:hypothetical protein